MALNRYNIPNPEEDHLDRDSDNEYTEFINEVAPTMESETIVEAEAFANPETQPAEETESPVQEEEEHFSEVSISIIFKHSGHNCDVLKHT